MLTINKKSTKINGGIFVMQKLNYFLRLRLRAASLLSLRFTLGFSYASCLRKSPMMPSFWHLRLKRFNALSTDSSFPTTTIVIVLTTLGLYIAISWYIGSLAIMLYLSRSELDVVVLCHQLKKLHIQCLRFDFPNNLKK